MNKKNEEAKGFPTIGEVTKFIIEAFDFYELVADEKTRAGLIKDIQRFSEEKDFDMDRAQEFIENVINKSFGKLIQNEVFFSELNNQITSILNGYKYIALNLNVSYINRERIVKTLITHYFVYQFSGLVRDLQNSQTGLIFPKEEFWWLPEEAEESKIKSPISNVLDWWADQTDCDSLYKLCQKIMKEKYKDRIENDKSFYESEKILLFYQKYNRWRKNNHLPSSFSIAELSGIDLGLTDKDQIPENSLKFNLFIARGIQYCLNNLEELFGIKATFVVIKNTKRYVKSDYLDTDINELFEHFRKRIDVLKEDNPMELKSKIVLTSNLLGNKYTSPIKEKDKDDQLKAQEVLGTLSKSEELNDSYILELQRARFYALQTDEKSWKEALLHYERAYEDGKYQAGIDLKPILTEGLVLSAKLGKLNVFKKFYKWANFYELFHEPYDEVKEYIVDQLTSQYYSIFNPKAYYKTDIKQYEKLNKEAYSDFLFSKEIIDNWKVDKRYPDRKIKGIGNYPLTQMMIAASFEKVDELKDLIQLKADPNIVADDGSTALIRAMQLQSSDIISEKQLECCNLLLELDLNPSINARTKRKRKTALMCAIESGIPELVEQVLKQGADINLKCSENCKDGLTPLYFTVNRIASLVKWINNNKRYVVKKEDFIKAMKLDNISRMMSGNLFHDDFKEQYNKFAKLNNENLFRITEYLLESIEHKKDSFYKIIDTFLINKAEVDVLHDYDFTELLLSSEIGDIKIFEKLLKYGANIKHQLVNKATVIGLAVGFGNYEFAEYLLDNYPKDMAELINIKYKNVESNKEYTVLYPLFMTFKDQSEIPDIIIRMTRKIFDLGFDKTMKEAGEYTILDIAKMSNNKKLVQILE